MRGKENKKVAKKIFLPTLANGKLKKRKRKKKRKKKRKEKEKERKKGKEFPKYRNSCSQVFLKATVEVSWDPTSNGCPWIFVWLLTQI